MKSYRILCIHDETEVMTGLREKAANQLSPITAPWTAPRICQNTAQFHIWDFRFMVTDSAKLRYRIYESGTLDRPVQLNMILDAWLPLVTVFK